MGILDTVIGSQLAEALRQFNPHGLVLNHLKELANREAQIVIARYGLQDGMPQTLENIGKSFSLTRERIRQIEKDSLKKLASLPWSEELERASDLIFQIIEEHGNILRESQLLHLLPPARSPIQQQAVLFILNIVGRFNPIKDTSETRQSWYIAGFEKELFTEIIASALTILKARSNALGSQELFQKIREQSDSEEIKSLSDQALGSIIAVSKELDKNPYEEWGLKDWPEIHPKDVGDKAYLVLKHAGKPEHYSKITDLINKQGFDKKVAHKETVHNELIKDNRFILIGRGIYALREWGYKSGVVADIIEEILGKAGQPLGREQIIAQVLKQRMVKRNTIIVGLSNKNRFQKTADNKYTNV